MVKKIAILPKLYDANGNIKKKWFVFFSYRNPADGKMKRFRIFDGFGTLYTKKDVMVILKCSFKNIQNCSTRAGIRLWRIHAVRYMKITFSMQQFHGHTNRCDRIIEPLIIIQTCFFRKLPGWLKKHTSIMFQNTGFSTHGF